MLNYLVELMEGDTVTSKKTVRANSPFAAAGMATTREITFMGDRTEWIRVTPPGKMPFEYSYAKPFGR